MARFNHQLSVLEGHISNVKLAKDIGVSEVVVRRILDPKHKSKPGQYIRALAALGATFQISVVRE